MIIARKLDDPAAGFSQRGGDGTINIQVFSRPTGDLCDTYTLKEVLGKGHSGEVRVAESSSGNRYACKTISKENLKAPNQNQFKRAGSNFGIKRRNLWKNLVSWVRRADRWRIRQLSRTSATTYGGENVVASAWGNENWAVTADWQERELSSAELRAEIKGLQWVAGHPNVIQLRGLFEDRIAVHLVMDLCSGGDLFEYMAAKRRLCEKEAAIIFRQIASALHHCHERGVVHRDVKPENVLMCANQTKGRDAKVKLADFGLAVRLGPSKQTTGQAGSAVYMAPEVIKGRAYGCEVDMWSLGVTLYIALSGFLPFWGRTNDEIFASIIRKEPDYRQKPWPSVSPDAKHLVRCLLTRDCNHRLKAAQFLADPWVIKHCSTKAVGGGCFFSSSGGQEGIQASHVPPVKLEQGGGSGKLEARSGWLEEGGERLRGSARMESGRGADIRISIPSRGVAPSPPLSSPGTPLCQEFRRPLRPERTAMPPSHQSRHPQDRLRVKSLAAHAMTQYKSQPAPSPPVDPQRFAKGEEAGRDGITSPLLSPKLSIFRSPFSLSRAPYSPRSSFTMSNGPIPIPNLSSAQALPQKGTKLLTDLSLNAVVLSATAKESRAEWGLYAHREAMRRKSVDSDTRQRGGRGLVTEVSLSQIRSTNFLSTDSEQATPLATPPTWPWTTPVATTSSPEVTKNRIPPQLVSPRGYIARIILQAANLHKDPKMSTQGEGLEEAGDRGEGGWRDASDRGSNSAGAQVKVKEEAVKLEAKVSRRGKMRFIEEFWLSRGLVLVPTEADGEDEQTNPTSAKGKKDDNRSILEKLRGTGGLLGARHKE